MASARKDTHSTCSESPMGDLRFGPSPAGSSLSGQLGHTKEDFVEQGFIGLCGAEVLPYASERMAKFSCFALFHLKLPLKKRMLPLAYHLRKFVMYQCYSFNLFGIEKYWGQKNG